MDRGYVKLWRKSIDSGLLQNPELWRFWCWCLLKASYKPHKQSVGMQVVELEPGQFIFGRQAAARELKTTERKIRTCVHKLENLQNLTIKTTNKFSIISIMNWELYQGNGIENDQQSDQQVTSKRPAGDHKQEGKKGNKELYTSNFLKFWEAYPRKEAKGKAFEAYQKIKEPKPTLKDILESVEKHKATKDWQTKQYIPHPATWINQRRWEDEIDTPINGTPRKTPEQIKAEINEALS